MGRLWAKEPFLPWTVVDKEVWKLTCNASRVFTGVTHLHPIILPLVPCPLQGVPQPGQDGGYPTQVRLGIIPGYPLSWDGVRMGVPPDRTTEGVLATWRVVCLLRSRSRTFLFLNVFTEFSEFRDQKKYFIKRIAVLKPAVSCIRNQHSTSVPQGHWWQRRSLIDTYSCFSDMSDSLNSLNSPKVMFFFRKNPKR